MTASCKQAMGPTVGADSWKCPCHTDNLLLSGYAWSHDKTCHAWLALCLRACSCCSPAAHLAVLILRLCNNDTKCSCSESVPCLAVASAHAQEACGRAGLAHVEGSGPGNRTRPKPPQALEGSAHTTPKFGHGSCLARPSASPRLLRVRHTAIRTAHQQRAVRLAGQHLACSTHRSHGDDAIDVADDGGPAGWLWWRRGCAGRHHKQQHRLRQRKRRHERCAGTQDAFAKATWNCASACAQRSMPSSWPWAADWCALAAARSQQALHVAMHCVQASLLASSRQARHACILALAGARNRSTHAPVHLHQDMRHVCRHARPS